MILSIFTTKKQMERIGKRSSTKILKDHRTIFRKKQFKDKINNREVLVS